MRDHQNDAKKALDKLKLKGSQQINQNLSDAAEMIIGQQSEKFKQEQLKSYTDKQLIEELIKREYLHMKTKHGEFILFPQ